MMPYLTIISQFLPKEATLVKEGAGHGCGHNMFGAGSQERQ
jgi:metal-dependent amidase/aminoacylase/carboxypeptidase family protein